MKYSVSGNASWVMKKRIDRVLGPVLRWIRGGTTRRGNPWAAVVMTFVLVQVSHRQLPLVAPYPIFFLVNSVDWFDEQNSSDRDDLLSLGLLRGESLLPGAGSRFGTEFSADV